MGKSKTVSFRLPEKLYQRFKEAASIEKATMTDLLNGFIEKQVEKLEKQIDDAYEIAGTERGKAGPAEDTAIRNLAVSYAKGEIPEKLYHVQLGAMGETLESSTQFEIELKDSENDKG